MSLHWGGRGPGHKSRWPKAAVTYEAETVSLIARMTTPPDVTRAWLINAAILSLKTAGLWAKLEVLYFLAAADSQAALLNWISSNYNATVVNAPTFTADRGYAGNGTSSYLSSNYTPSSSSLFLQDSASFGVYANGGSTTAANTVALGANSNSFAQRITLQLRYTGDLIRAQANGGAEVTPISSVTTTLGFTAVSRTGSSGISVYRDAATATGTTASTGRPSTPIFICASSNSGTPFGYTTARIGMAFAGAGLSDAEMLDLRTIATTYLTAIGAQ